MPDLQWLAAFADHPITLIIIMIAGLLGLWIWKIGPTFKFGIKSITDEVAKNTTKIDTISTQIEEIKSHDAAQDKQINTILFSQLRKTIFDERVPISDRIAAAIRYTRSGGNSATKEFIENKLRPENIELYKTLEEAIKE